MSLWETQYSKGKKGEEVIAELMRSRGHEVVDLTADPQYFEDDIDFIISGRTCELKTDARIGRTNNLFLEDIIHYSNGREADGYFRKCKAQFLFYYDSSLGYLYIYDLEQLRSYVKENNPSKRTCNDGYKLVKGIIVNKDAVAHQTIKVN